MHLLKRVGSERSCLCLEMEFDRYIKVRKNTEKICSPLQTEYYVVQPIDFVSPLNAI